MIERGDRIEEHLSPARSREIDPSFFWTYDVLACSYVARKSPGGRRGSFASYSKQPSPARVLMSTGYA